MRPTSDRDRLIAALARRQHGVFNHAQALAGGFDDDAIHRRLACGAWVRLARGAYALAGSVLSTWRQYKAAQLSVPDAVVSGLAAARLHDLPDFPVVRAEISVPVARTHRTRLATVHRWTIPPRVVTVRGIRVTSVAQTLIDIAPQVDELRLERAMDDSLLTGRVAIATLTERLAAYAGSRRPGLSIYRALVAERAEEGYAPTETELEARLLRLVRMVPECGRVVVQPSLPWRPHARGRLDVLLPDVSALVEGDGRRWHARVRDFDADRERDNEAVIYGLRPLRFTWRHVTACQSMVLRQLRRLADRPAA